MKYKLIKSYPGYTKDQVGKISWFGPKNLLHPEEYPEFWEEVIEKDYEILSFKSNSNFIYYLLDKTYISSSGLCSSIGIDYGIKHFNIHSVKRLSDGEIFTVGDLLVDKFCQLSRSFPIANFRIQNNELLINAYLHKGESGFYNYRIKDLNKRKLPLFTTQDGVDIFEGDEHYSIGGSKGLWEYENKIFKHIAKIGTGQLHESNCIQGDKIYWLKFSTKEKAEEYIFLNKPCLSLNDVASIYKTAENMNVNAHYHKFTQKYDLQQLVKSKLNIK